MRLLGCLPAVLFVFALLDIAALANTEKTIFIASAPIHLPAAALSLDALHLAAVAPAAASVSASLRTSLSVAFPTAAAPSGRDSWFLLHSLREGQRYEARICWAAIQPTDFHLDVYNITHVFDSPPLIQSLSLFSEQQISRQDSAEQPSSQSFDFAGTVLFLRVQSAADFFTTNKTLMQNPPLVDVDIILDPYLANIFPQSLLPTAAYLIALAVGAWFMSGAVWKLLQPLERGKQHLE